jgi:Ca2+-binding EF-hand superfamily protein
MRAIYGMLGTGSLLGLLLVTGPAMAQTASPPTLKEWFQLKDKNGDGKLDREEFQQAVVEMFFFRDKDKNGYLTIEELQGTASPAAVKAASRKGQEGLTLDEFVNALFKDFAAADTDGDGDLTLEEIDVYIHANRR